MSYTFDNSIAWIRVKGIYAFYCKPVGKYYIGHTFGKDGLKGRWHTHRNRLQNNKHDNKALQLDYNKYGANNFELTCLEIVDDHEIILGKETEYILKFDSLNPEHGYNLDLPFGHKVIRSEETIAKLRKAAIGRTRTPHSELTKQKLSEAHLGKKMSEEAIETRLKVIANKPLLELTCSLCKNRFNAKFHRKTVLCEACKIKKWAKKFREANKDKVAAQKRLCYLKRREHYLLKAKLYREKQKNLC